MAKTTPYDTLAGYLESRQEEDIVLYESEYYYICKRGEETFYFAKWYTESDDETIESIVRLNSNIVPCGILSMIHELLEYKFMYDELQIIQRDNCYEIDK